MKPNHLISLILAIVLLIVQIPVYAIADPLTSTEELTEDVEFTTGVFEDGDRQEEHYLTYRPGNYIMPWLWYGERTLGEKAVFDQAAAQAKELGKRVIAGTNGDYFVVSTGQPVGIVISEGRLITSDGGNPAIGFFEDGTAFFGLPQLKMSMDLQGAEYRLGGINKPIHTGDFFLYTNDIGSHTPVTVKTRNLVLIPEESGSLSIGGSCTAVVESNDWSDGAVSIPEGKWVICLTADSDDWRLQALDSAAPGDTVVIRVSSDDLRWNACSCATGSLYKLISGGEIENDLDRADRSRAPRSAVGILQDGSIMLYTIDGRQRPYSAGLSLQELAQRLLSLGCVEAGALDGGGSTVIHAQPAGEEDAVLRSSPSDGREREVSTFLMLVTEGESSGIGHTLSVRSGESVVLCGTLLQCEAGICDEKGVPVISGRLTWDATDGTISPDGVFTAPDYGCSAVISAECGDLRGQKTIRVIQTPDAIRIHAENSGSELTRLELARGESIDLTASSTWNLTDIYAEDEQYNWTCSGNAGRIDSAGRFTASEIGGNGTITVSAGDASMTIGVYVEMVYLCLRDYEQAADGHTESLNWQCDHSADRVRYGHGSLRIQYDLSEGSAEYPVDWNHREKAEYLYMWVFGDSSGNSLYARIRGNDMLLATLDFTGWKLLQLDTGSSGIDALQFRGKGSGSVWLDQIIVSNCEIPDLEAPEIELRSMDQQIRATISDRSDGYPEQAMLTLFQDGKELPFRYDSASGRLTAETENDGLLHRITLIARDRSGNIRSASVMLQGETDTPFDDMSGHWAEEYAGYLFNRGIIAGRSVDGRLLFDPNTPVTRAEFAVLLSRWLGLENDEGVMPGFSDADDIPAWALEGVRAATAAGLIQGEQDGDILRFKPLEALNRAQAATILGRTLEGGREFADLVFPDAEQIPAWAASHVSLMCYMGVLSGFEDGTFRPYDVLTRAQAAKLLTVMS